MKCSKCNKDISEDSYYYRVTVRKMMVTHDRRPTESFDMDEDRFLNVCTECFKEIHI